SQPSTDRVIDGAVKWLEDFISLVGLKSKIDSNRIDDARWIPLDRGKFLVDVDAATYIRIGDRCMRIIIKDSVGEVICAKVIHWPFPISIEAAEVLAIKWGIITALETGLSGFSISSNCASIVNALNDMIKCFCESENILDE